MVLYLVAVNSSDGSFVDMTHSAAVAVTAYNDSRLRVASLLGIKLSRAIQGAIFVCRVNLTVDGLGSVYQRSVRAHTTGALCKSSLPPVNLCSCT